MLTKRQEREKRLAIRAFIYGIIVLLTLFLPHAKLGELYFSGLEFIFGDILYHTHGIITLNFSFFNLILFFLPVLAGITLFTVDRVIKYESKTRLWMSLMTSIMFLISIVMFYILPETIGISIDEHTFQGLIQLYVGPFIAFVFMTTGLLASLLYLYQEIKIHQTI